jgi:hypothetical protein
MIPLLEFLAYCKDTREIIKKIVINDEVNYKMVNTIINNVGNPNSINNTNYSYSPINNKPNMYSTSPNEFGRDYDRSQMLKNVDSREVPNSNVNINFISHNYSNIYLKQRQNELDNTISAKSGNISYGSVSPNLVIKNITAVNSLKENNFKSKQDPSVQNSNRYSSLMINNKLKTIERPSSALLYNNRSTKDLQIERKTPGPYINSFTKNPNYLVGSTSLPITVSIQKVSNGTPTFKEFVEPRTRTPTNYRLAINERQNEISELINTINSPKREDSKLSSYKNISCLKSNDDISPNFSSKSLVNGKSVNTKIKSTNLIGTPYNRTNKYVNSDYSCVYNRESNGNSQLANFNSTIGNFKDLNRNNSRILVSGKSTQLFAASPYKRTDNIYDGTIESGNYSQTMRDKFYPVRRIYNE